MEKLSDHNPDPMSEGGELLFFAKFAVFCVHALIAAAVASAGIFAFGKYTAEAVNYGNHPHSPQPDYLWALTAAFCLASALLAVFMGYHAFITYKGRRASRGKKSENPAKARQ